MKIVFWLVLFCAGIFSQERVSFQDGLGDSARKEKNLLVYFYRENCPYCRQMDTYVFSEKNVETLISKHYIFSTVDMDSAPGKKLSEKYGFYASPSFLFLGKDGKVIAKMSGSRDADTFARELEKYKKYIH